MKEMWVGNPNIEFRINTRESSSKQAQGADEQEIS